VVDQTKNGTRRGVPFNPDAADVLEAEREKHPLFCFTYRGEPITRDCDVPKRKRASR